ncbi:MDFIC [Cervus elaphus hippelaphus]|uniref:MDFIC n=1 Tax=Cervus elaphus hippelaphus TaxID=46360 RepID=A0A212CKL8_CEREH|nr:MDFIC [Cervus elaphus hippelaphus]
MSGAGEALAPGPQRGAEAGGGRLGAPAQAQPQRLPQLQTAAQESEEEISKIKNGHPSLSNGNGIHHGAKHTRTYWMDVEHQDYLAQNSEIEFQMIHQEKMQPKSYLKVC